MARAYGAAGELVRAMRRDPSRRVANLLGLALAAADAAKLLGVQWTAVAAVVHAFDHHTTAGSGSWRRSGWRSTTFAGGRASRRLGARCRRSSSRGERNP